MDEGEVGVGHRAVRPRFPDTGVDEDVITHRLGEAVTQAVPLAVGGDCGRCGIGDAVRAVGVSGHPLPRVDAQASDLARSAGQRVAVSGPLDSLHNQRRVHADTASSSAPCAGDAAGTSGAVGPQVVP